MLPAGADPQADGRLEEDDVRDDDEREARPGQDVEVAERLPEEAGAREDVDVRQDRDAVGDPAVVVELDEEVAGYPDARKLTPVPPTIWSARRWIANQA